MSSQQQPQQGAAQSMSEQEREYLRRHGQLPPANAAHKHLIRRDRKFFDSADYSMVKAKSQNEASVIARLPKVGPSPSGSPGHSPQVSPRGGSAPAATAASVDTSHAASHEGVVPMRDDAATGSTTTTEREMEDLQERAAELAEAAEDAAHTQFGHRTSASGTSSSS